MSKHLHIPDGRGTGREGVDGIAGMHRCTGVRVSGSKLFQVVGKMSLHFPRRSKYF